MSGFDDWGWGDVEQEAAAAEAQTLLPPGRYSAQVTKCSLTVKDRIPPKWMEKNPEGEQMSFVLEVMVAGRRHVIYTDIPKHWGWLGKQACEAAGVDRTIGVEAIALAMVGKRVDVETTIWDGRKVQVDRWYQTEAIDATPPEPAPEPAKPRPARTPHQKAKAATAAAGLPPDDDIPF
jgi:hypothetical protein